MWSWSSKSIFEAAEKDKDGDISDFLKKDPSWLSAKNSDGNTALHVAALHNSIGSVKKLIRKGAPIDVLNAKGQTALYLAAGRGHDQTVKVLLEALAKANTRCMDTKTTALHAAAMSGSLPVAKQLLMWAADVNATSMDGIDPLRIAAGKGDTGMVELLLEYGAEVKEGSKSLEAAAAYPSILARLKQQQALMTAAVARGAAALAAAPPVSVKSAPAVIAATKAPASSQPGSDIIVTKDQVAAAKDAMDMAKMALSFSWIKDPPSVLKDAMLRNGVPAEAFKGMASMASGVLSAISIAEKVVDYVQTHFKNSAKAKELEDQVTLIGRLMKQLHGQLTGPGSGAGDEAASAVNNVGNALMAAYDVLEDWRKRSEVTLNSIRGVISKLMTVVSSKSINEKLVGAKDKLTTAFNQLGTVASIMTAAKVLQWPQHSQKAAEEDMRQLLEEVKRQGEEGKACMKELLLKQSDDDRQYVAEMMRGFSSELTNELKALGLGIHQRFDKLDNNMGSLHAKVDTLSDRIEQLMNDRIERGQQKGKPADLWRMEPSEFIKAMDIDRDKSVGYEELADFLGQYGLRVGDVNGRALFNKFGKLKKDKDAEELKEFLEDIWDWMLDGRADVKNAKVVLSKEETAYFLKDCLEDVDLDDSDDDDDEEDNCSDDGDSSFYDDTDDDVEEEDDDDYDDDSFYDPHNENEMIADKVLKDVPQDGTCTFGEVVCYKLKALKKKEKKKEERAKKAKGKK